MTSLFCANRSRLNRVKVAMRRTGRMRQVRYLTAPQSDLGSVQQLEVDQRILPV